MDIVDISLWKATKIVNANKKMRKLTYKNTAIKRKKREEGLTLIEVLITIVIITGILISFLGCFIYGLNSISRMKQTVIATQCVQEQLELIRNMSFDDILSLGSSFTNESLTPLQISSGIITVEDSFGSDIKKLTVSVLWVYRGKQMRKDIVTYLTREGINKK